MASGLVNQIRAQFRRWPLVSNCSLYLVLYAGGEFSQQTLRRQRPVDTTSIRNVSLLGCFAFAPFNFTWYRILDRLVVGTGRSIVAKKILCDQLVAGSIGVCIFYIGLAILERRENKFTELEKKGIETYKTSCMYWPLVQTLNFAFVPSSLRAAYVGCAAFVWTNILCFFKNKE